jgi:hypothetical protein
MIGKYILLSLYVHNMHWCIVFTPFLILQILTMNEILKE